MERYSKELHLTIDSQNNTILRKHYRRISGQIIVDKYDNYYIYELSQTSSSSSSEIQINLSDC